MRALLVLALVGCGEAPPAFTAPTLAAPLAGRFVEIGAVDLERDASTLQTARPHFLDERRAIVSDDATLDARAIAIEGARMVDAGPAPYLVAAADIDGDGAIDCVGLQGIRWACAGESQALPGGPVFPVGMVSDLDGDGALDLVDASDGVALRWRRQVAPRVFAVGPACPAPCVSVQQFRRVGGAVGAIGWTCDFSLPPRDRPSVPIWHRLDGGAWSSSGAEYRSPMDALDLGDAVTLVSEHPDHLVIRDGVRLDVPPAFRWQWTDPPNAAPMIPWGIARISVEGRDLIAIAHGIDSWGNEEHRAIGFRRSRVLVWERAGDEWRLVPATGLERAGEWRWIAARGEVVIIGGHGEPARVYVWRP